MTKPFPLTVLFVEGPIARAYLVAMRRLGIKADRIIQLVPRRHPVSRKPSFPWLPTSLRMACAQRVDFATAHHWPRRLAKSFKPRFTEDDTFEWSSADLAEIRQPIPLDQYALTVERLLVDDVNDAAVSAALADEVLGAKILFTGGGKLTTPLLENPELNFLHVHPGVLPDVRGADGVLWSYAVRGKPGASVFIMDAGIDTGRVLHIEEFPGAAVTVLGQRPDTITQYRILFSFLDPIIRAVTMERFLKVDPAHWNNAPQTVSAGTTYHFMHERLIGRVLPHLVHCKNF